MHAQDIRQPLGPSADTERRRADARGRILRRRDFTVAAIPVSPACSCGQTTGRSPRAPVPWSPGLCAELGTWRRDRTGQRHGGQLRPCDPTLAGRRLCLSRPARSGHDRDEGSRGETGEVGPGRGIFHLAKSVETSAALIADSYTCTTHRTHHSPGRRCAAALAEVTDCRCVGAPFLARARPAQCGPGQACDYRLGSPEPGERVVLVLSAATSPDGSTVHDQPAHPDREQTQAH